MRKEKPESKNSGKTIGDVFNTFTEEQKTVVYALVGQALQEQKSGGKDEEDEEDEEEMKHNVFDEGTAQQTDVLSHSEMAAIFADAKRYGSLKDSIIAHGIENIDFLFPDARNVTQTPQFIERERTWVPKVMNGTHHTPFSRIKSLFADITADEARARGYTKGNKKIEEVFTLLKRTTSLAYHLFLYVPLELYGQGLQPFRQDAKVLRPYTLLRSQPRFGQQYHRLINLLRFFLFRKPQQARNVCCLWGLLRILRHW
ncbi:MAG: hypothetical protein LUH47_02825 [Clostridiales bacterium]|nr:hypothetical protein [Clostridiales bacterium]